MLINKVKLLQDLPNVDKGAILIRYIDNESMFFVMPTYGLVYEVSEDVVLGKTNWFATYLFTSKDGIDIYKGDYVCVVTMSDRINEVFNYKSLLQDSHCLYFSSKELAEQYLESLNPIFKVGDIAFISKYNHFAPLTQRDIDSIPSWEEECYYVTKATNKEIIKYYEQQGWVKDAKFKSEGESCFLNNMYFGHTEEFIVESTGYKRFNVKDCELIKEPDYPKSWVELTSLGEKCNNYIIESNKSTYNTKSQAQSSLAFAQLTQLHAETIRIYNVNNNCDWKPDWNTHNTLKWVVVRKEDKISTSPFHYNYYHLAFPNKELADFALKNWSKLWEQYYEL